MADIVDQMAGEATSFVKDFEDRRAQKPRVAVTRILWRASKINSSI